MVQGDEKQRRLVCFEQPPEAQGSTGLGHADRPLDRAHTGRPGFLPGPGHWRPAAALSNCARHRGLSWDIFDARHEAMRALFGIAVMQRVIASPMQAARSSAVGLLTLASAAVESTLASKPTTPNIVVRILIMTISLGRALALQHGTDDGCLCSPRPGTGCDGNHTNSFFVLSAVIAAYRGFGAMAVSGRARRGPPCFVPSSRNRVRRYRLEIKSTQGWLAAPVDVGDPPTLSELDEVKHHGGRLAQVLE